MISKGVKKSVFLRSSDGFLSVFLLFIDLSAVFNSLGQLGGSVLEIKTNNLDLLAGTTGVNPLKLIFSARVNSRTFDYEHSMPGPVKIMKNQDGSYRIQYRHFDLSSLSGAYLDHKFLIESFGLSVVDSTGLSEEDQALRSAIIFDPLVNNMKLLMKNLGLEHLLEGGGK